MRRNKNLVTILLISNIIFLIALILAIVYIILNVNNAKIDENIINNNENEVGNNIERNDNDEENVENEAKKLEIETYNANFISYEGNELSSGQIKALLSQIEISNTDAERKVELSENGITKMEQVEEDKKYKVEFSYDTDGYISEIKITDTSITPTENDNNQNATTDLDKIIFNTKFTSYAGTITGEKLNSLLTTIQSSNATNAEHQITLSSNNLSDLNGIGTTDEYIIELTFGEDGYVSNINIDKKI